ncbi:hypothetical protein CTEN210_05460 [Chaetoceros tenuissimus]|uniref:Uncharacterized protein n=1 Tax=Chaetoceros tenuissimus TaxID=426638 RepID=A0AAD3CNH9_9STRA|nr:hypothetical protein CTEN210_05456 [Chaetoceros tenuissimus]GFH48984.1 hypothetical protein CTEN210_05460 [Chaetoceros tenuissimus]
MYQLPIFNSSLSTSASNEIVGYWKWTNNQSNPAPLQTRYQRQNCRGAKTSKKECLESGSMDRFSSYSYEFLNSNFIQYHNLQKNNELKICAGGQSHARFLSNHLSLILTDLNITSIEIGHVPLSYPREMSSRRIINRAKLCNITILGLGQWSAGKKPRKVIPATLFEDYFKELEQGILFWKKNNINFFFRKTHYNPLGDIKNTCPPTDWRSPSVIDGYNEITRFLTKKHNITFIESGSVIDAMWDSAEDFCHYSGKEGRTEALFFLQKILNN